MNTPEYSLLFSEPHSVKPAWRWLLLGVIALGVAGIFAALLANTQSAFFYTALVVHVDLSVLVWFLTMACMFFALASAGRGIAVLEDAAFLCMCAGAALIVLSALSGGEAYMSNYIPVIHHPVFFLGLSLLLCSVLGMIGNVLAANWHNASCNAQSFGVITAALIMLVAIVCFALSLRSLPASMTGQSYYEYAFWGGGHLLQFVHTQLMVVCWLWLAQAAGVRVKLHPVVLKALYSFGLFAAAVSLLIYYVHVPTSDEHRTAFTMLMKHGNGVAAIVAGVVIVWGLKPPPAGGRAGEGGPESRHHPPPGTPLCPPASGGRVREDASGERVPWGGNHETTLPKITLFMSMLLFAAGGGLGYMIAGSNVTVPAHYHGSIVGVTLAYMGVAYLLLPHFGFADVARSTLAKIQPFVYGGGQLCWMTGMAILGAHGVPRKTPGSADTVGALASILKHGGDGLALIGGLLFVFVVLRSAVIRLSDNQINGSSDHPII